MKTNSKIADGSSRALELRKLRSGARPKAGLHPSRLKDLGSEVGDENGEELKDVAEKTTMPAARTVSKSDVVTFRVNAGGRLLQVRQCRGRRKVATNG